MSAPLVIDCSLLPSGPVEIERALRGRRNRLLAETDWTQLPDVPLSAERRQEWASYRQALRDHPLGPFPEPPRA